MSPCVRLRRTISTATWPHGSPSALTWPRTGIGAPRRVSVPPSVIASVDAGRSSGPGPVTGWSRVDVEPEPPPPLLMPHAESLLVPFRFGPELIVPAAGGPAALPADAGARGSA